jgi:hypothetical protein
MDNKESIVEEPVAEKHSVTDKEKEEAKFTASQLQNVLSQKQKKALGLLPLKHVSDKVKARNEALRQRMLKINEERRLLKKQETPKVEKTEKSEKKQVEEPPKKRKIEESESDDEDPYIQKKAKKVTQTLKQLSKVEQHIQMLRQQHEHNPFFKLLIR